MHFYRLSILLFTYELADDSRVLQMFNPALLQEKDDGVSSRKGGSSGLSLLQKALTPILQ